MEKKIKLRTHDGSANYLESIEDENRPNTYKLVTAVPFIRGGQVADGREFIDPSGGPMLVVGELVEGTPYTIESIQFEKGVGQLITLK